VYGWWLASYLVLWALVVVLCLVLVSLARQVGRSGDIAGYSGARAADTDGPSLDEALEPEELSDIHGAPVTVGGPGPRQLMLFVSPGCGVCDQVLPALPAIAKNGQVTPLVMTDADSTEARLSFAASAARAWVISAPSLMQRYNVPATPYVVVTDRLGIVRAKEPLTGLEELEALVVSAASRVHVGGR
jgi:methylamine dehydrogenase accessory protein MauD